MTCGRFLSYYRDLEFVVFCHWPGCHLAIAAAASRRGGISVLHFARRAFPVRVRIMSTALSRFRPRCSRRIALPSDCRPSAISSSGWPIAVIILAFPFIAVPMAAVVFLAADHTVLWIYTWLFAMTHFVVTFAVYLRSTNLRYFASSPCNVMIFFAVPAAMFLVFDLYHALRVGAVSPCPALLLGALRLADFNHFTRQLFGVLQLFKSRTGIKLSAEFKRTENLYFCSITGLVFTTYLAGGFCPLAQPGGTLEVVSLCHGLFPADRGRNHLAARVAGLFSSLAIPVRVRLHRLRRTAGSSASLGYLIVQSLAGLAAAVYFPLYLAAGRPLRRISVLMVPLPAIASRLAQRLDRRRLRSALDRSFSTGSFGNRRRGDAGARR